MEITSRLLSQCRLVSHVKHIYYGNLFHHIDNNYGGKILFVYDGNVSHIVENYKSYAISTLCLAEYKALPTFKNVEEIQRNIAENNIKVLYGFGTGAINDLCKYAAYKSKIPYTFCPTALSMNGISSNNVSLFDDERQVKVSLMAMAPRIIILEPNILSNAPIKFIGSAIMDSLAAYTACNDFIYASSLDSHLYSYDYHLFTTFKTMMEQILAIIHQGSVEAFSKEVNTMLVFDMLFFSGLVMNHHQSSIAFSGGEHAIAHTLEGKFPELSHKFLHGEVISAVLPYYSELQKSYTKHDYIDRKTVIENNAIDFTSIALFFEIPTSFQDIGISKEQFNLCVSQAKFVKERPTILNLLY